MHILFSFCQNSVYQRRVRRFYTMKNMESISILHALLLVMTFIGLKNHVTIIPSILKAVGRDGWASVLGATISTFFWLFLLVYIHNKTKQGSVREWLQQKIGKVGATIVLYIIAYFLIILAAFTMRETLLWISTTFLPETPMLFLFLLYLLLTVYLATAGLTAITIANTLVLAGVIILGFFISIVNQKVKDYELLLPFFEHGINPILKGMIYPASGFVELLILLFLQHKIKNQMKWYHFAIILLILTGLTCGPLVGAITEFGPVEAAKQRYPAYEEWGLGSIGRFIEHMDFFSIYQWLTGTFIRVGFLLYISAELLNLTENKKEFWKKLVPPFAIICLSLVLIKDTTFLKLNEYYLLIVTFIFFVSLSIFFSVVAMFSKKSTNKDPTGQESGEQQSKQTEAR